MIGRLAGISPGLTGAVAIGLTVVVLQAAGLVPVWFSPLVAAFVLGLLGSSAVRRLEDRRHVSKLGALGLQVGVALLGVRVAGGDLMEAGPGLLAAGIAVAVFGAASGVGYALLLGLGRAEASVVGAGSGICGASAAAAAAAAVRAPEPSVPWVIMTLTVVGFLAIPLIFLAADALGLDAQQRDLWLGLALPEVAQVAVAETLPDGPTTGSAMLAKLVRVSLLGPLTIALAVFAGERQPGRGSPFRLPPYLLGFVGLMVLSLCGVIPQAVRETLLTISGFALAVGLASIGLAFNRRRPSLQDGRIVLATTLALISVVVIAGAAAVVAG